LQVPQKGFFYTILQPILRVQNPKSTQNVTMCEWKLTTGW
jgi:hypothetical protein